MDYLMYNGVLLLAYIVFVAHILFAFYVLFQDYLEHYLGGAKQEAKLKSGWCGKQVSYYEIWAPIFFYYLFTLFYSIEATFYSKRNKKTAKPRQRTTNIQYQSFNIGNHSANSHLQPYSPYKKDDLQQSQSSHSALTTPTAREIYRLLTLGREKKSNLFYFIIIVIGFALSLIHTFIPYLFTANIRGAPHLHHPHPSPSFNHPRNATYELSENQQQICTNLMISGNFFLCLFFGLFLSELGFGLVVSNIIISIFPSE
jgi:hypothetical protein